MVDDEPSITRVVYEYLKGEGCRMKTAADVKTALNMLGENSFDFVVCDIKMPEMGGSEFHQFIKEMKPLLLGRIIYCTGDVLGIETKAFVNSVNNPVIGNPSISMNLKRLSLKLLARINRQPPEDNKSIKMASNSELLTVF